MSLRSLLQYVSAVLALVCLQTGPARAVPQLVDQIVAVVDDEIVLRSEVMAQIQLMVMGEEVDRDELTPAKIKELFDQVLENMIQERLLLARAKIDSIEADRDMIEESVRSRLRELKTEHGEAEFNAKLAEAGLLERDVREQLRQEYKKDFLRREMYTLLSNSIEVSYGDVAAYRETHAKELPELLSISHILIKAKPSEDQDTSTKLRAEALLDRVRKGEDFATLARDYSDDTGSAEVGGDLGYFSRGSMVPEFEEVAFGLSPGDVSEPVKTSFGYHIIRCEAVAGDEVRARHILLSLRTGDAEQAAARDLAESIRKRAMAGEDFAKLAREYSEDSQTASAGGVLPGLYSVGNLPPAFSEEIKWMKLGQVGSPVETEYGWHVVKLNDDRESIEGVLRQVRIQEKFDEMIAETRERMYVETRVVDIGM
jgi:peptidyl-prolyl cis-trans isomerase SurA